MCNPRATTTGADQRGFFLIEVLAMVLLFGFLGLMLAHSNILASHIRQRSNHNSQAMQSAIQEMEYYATIDPATLDASDNVNDFITRNNIRFQRSVSILVNADTSRTLTVTIEDRNSSVGGRASLTDKFLLWGSQ